jgi:Ca2+-binding RTX toxin-like protein
MGSRTFAVLVAATFAPAAPASAGVLSVASPAADPGATYLTFTAAAGEANDLQLNLQGDGRMHARDWDAPLTSSAPGCTPVPEESRDAFLCDMTGIGGLAATLGDGDDTLGSPGDFPLPIVATGGPGNDTLLPGLGRHVFAGGPGDDGIGAGPAADRLSGGPGRDRLTGYGGRDRLDGGSEADDLAGMQGDDRSEGRDLVDCGPGRDTAVVDRLDVLRGCERVRYAE